jgi:fatty-acyl-CoA synthase
VTLHRVLDRWATIQPSKTALHFEGEDFSYAALAQRTMRVGEGLARELGVGRGDRVAYLGFNRPEVLVLLFALARMGAMLLPLNFRLAPAEHHAILEHAEAKALIADPEFLAAAQVIATGLPSLRLVAMRESRPGWLSWGALTTGGAADVPASGQLDDPALLVYTSGTTGRPKGAVHTQAGLIWNAVNAIHCADLTSQDHVLTVLPMFHVGGLCIQTLPALYAGATVTLHPRFDPGRWLADVAARRPTLSLLVPATLRAILEHPGWAGADLSSLRAVYTGSSLIPDSLFPPFHARGIPLGQVYGATETGPVSICTRIEDTLRKAGSAGKAALHCDIRLVSTDGADTAVGEVGEIWVRAPNVMRGYWKEPDHPAFRDGWFHSGDLARQDAEGFYWVVGRSKEMIISGGENIYPAEIENVLATCHDIREVSVVGIPDSRWGEVAVAAIVRRPSSALDEAGVLRLLEGKLARFKHPRRVVFVDALPKTALGKVQKGELLQALLDAH